jgi:hypothetical protein
MPPRLWESLWVSWKSFKAKKTFEEYQRREILRKLLQEEDAVVSQDTSRSREDRQTPTRRNTGRKN